MPTHLTCLSMTHCRGQQLHAWLANGCRHIRDSSKHSGKHVGHSCKRGLHHVHRMD
jgi:hypothetical protein